MSHIYLPISLGEAIDKLTILDIKVNKINDDRKIDVQNEYNLLYNKLSSYILKYNNIYQSMKKINILIWDMMDILRDGNINNDLYLKICKDCIEYNDVRFRIKNKFNYLSESSLKEQKSYKINHILIEISNNIENLHDFINPIKYYSFMYDKISILYNGPSKLLHDTFTYDSTITFIDTQTNINYKKHYIFSKNNLNKDDIYNIFNITDDLINKF